jgi:hypothetical protein
LNTIRCNDWKVHFAIIEGRIVTGERVVTMKALKLLNEFEEPFPVNWS